MRELEGFFGWLIGHHSSRLPHPSPPPYSQNIWGESTKRSSLQTFPPIFTVDEGRRHARVFGVMIVVTPLTQRIIATCFIITNSSFSLQGSYQIGRGEEEEEEEERKRGKRRKRGEEKEEKEEEGGRDGARGKKR